uniref:Uncharacterized protein n=1 Tax=Clostridium perfringens TaxID=1502 RepID=F7J096_CLOPF|nr:hypothetical protein [Clostridium perfringens]
MKKFLVVFLVINLVLGLIFLSIPGLNKNKVVLA